MDMMMLLRMLLRRCRFRVDAVVTSVSAPLLRAGALFCRYASAIISMLLRRCLIAPCHYMLFTPPPYACHAAADAALQYASCYAVITRCREALLLP